MKVLTVCGYSDSGKTTTIEYITRELTARGYQVGSVKEIHYEGFAMDREPGSNTWRHRAAGAGVVTARGLNETDILFPSKLPIRKILSFYEGFDYVLCEGVRDIAAPMILAAQTEEELEIQWNDYVFCVSGKVADGIDEYRGIPAISAIPDAGPLVKRIEEMVYESLPGMDSESCGACGGDCREMGVRILRGEATRGDCVSSQDMELIVGGKRIVMVPFVRNALRGSILGFVRELKGCREGAEVEIRIRPR